MDEEIVMLEEQLAAAHADIERLQSRVAEAESLAATRNDEVSSLRLQLTERDSRVAEQRRRSKACEAPSSWHGRKRGRRSSGCDPRCWSVSRSYRQSSCRARPYRTSTLPSSARVRPSRR